MATIIDKAKDMLSGVFGASETPSKEPINTPKQQKLVDMALNDYSYYKSERQTYEPTWRQEQRFYSGDHWHGLRPQEVTQQRPNSVDNVAWSQIESITAKLCSWMPYPEFEPAEEQDEQKAQELNAYMPYELRCIKFQPKHIRAVRRMVIHGPLIYKVLYDPTVEGGSGMYRYIGQNDVIPVDMGSFFPDPRIRDFIDLQKGAAHMFHFRKPLEYFKQRFGKQGEKVQPDMSGDDVFIYDQDDYSVRNFTSDRTGGDSNGGDSQMAGLIEYWYRGKPKLMTEEDRKIFEELAQDKLAQGLDPSECLAKAKGAMNGIHCLYISAGGVFLEHKSYVYDHGHYPIVARTLFPDEDNPWGKGYMRDMIRPQVMLNKFAEIAVETMAKEGNNVILYEKGAIANPERFRRDRSTPGALLEVVDISGVKELQGVNVPQTVFNMLEYYKEMLQKIPGQFDSSNGQANPNVKSGEQAKALIAAASNRLIIATELIEDALSEVFEQYISNMAQFYVDERVGRVTGKQVSMSRQTLVNTMPSEAELTDPTTGENVTIPVQEEYVPKFDIAVKVGAEKPTDRDYWIQTAFNLFQTIDPTTQMPMIDAEAVRYTVQNGRMEPFDVIKERMQTEQQRLMQMQDLQAQNQQLQSQVQQIMSQLGMAQQQNITAERDMMMIQKEQQDKAVNYDLQQRKLDIEELKVIQQAQRQMF